MHFSIPDTSDCSDKNGSYHVFNVHVNGVYHCSVRYKQLHNFHEQLKKEFGPQFLPPFPPKKLLSLTATQLEDRRFALERYMQIVSQSPQISNSDIFNGFLLNAQQESQKENPEDVVLDVFLMNGHKIAINVSSTDQTDDVLEAVASSVELQEDYVYHFGLFLIKREEDSEPSIVRKLQEFESPFISLKAANQQSSHRIVLRKSFWDPSYEDDLMEDRVAMNLLYVQAVNDIEQGWVDTSKDQLRQLMALQQRNSKKEYLRFAKTLKHYSYMQFKPCMTDYPAPGSHAIVCAGNRELILRTQVKPVKELKEFSFKVTRMRCWRITTTVPDIDGETVVNGDKDSSQLELAFEYLVARDTLQWITLYTEQAILLSMCLQGMVDELIMKKEGRRLKRPHDRHKRNSVKRDNGSNSTKQNAAPAEPSNQRPSSYTSSVSNSNGGHKATISRKLHGIESAAADLLTGKVHNSQGVQGNRSRFTENDAFEGIGDDDL